jgi:hypothetical protein
VAVTPEQYYAALEGVKIGWIDERDDLLAKGVIAPTWSPAGRWEGSPTAEQKRLAQLTIDISEYQYLQQRITDGYVRIDPVGGGLKHFSTLADPEPPPPPPPPPLPPPPAWEPDPVWLTAPPPEPNAVATTVGTFFTADEIHHALKAGATVPGRQVVYLDQYDAFLIDGAPVSWWIDRVWYPGQQEALRELLDSGAIPGLVEPPGYAWADPVVAAPVTVPPPPPPPPPTVVPPPPPPPPPTVVPPPPPPPPPTVVPPPPPVPDRVPGGPSITTTVGTFFTADEIHHALKAGATVPGRQVFYLDQYDAFLIDGAPVSWWIDGVWYEGQQEALRELIESGEFPGLVEPPGYAWADPVVPIPPSALPVPAATEAAGVGGLLLLAAPFVVGLLRGG